MKNENYVVLVVGFTPSWAAALCDQLQRSGINSSVRSVEDGRELVSELGNLRWCRFDVVVYNSDFDLSNPSDHSIHPVFVKQYILESTVSSMGRDVPASVLYGTIPDGDLSGFDGAAEQSKGLDSLIAVIAEVLDRGSCSRSPLLPELEEASVR